MSGLVPVLASIMSSVRSMTLRLRRPRKSILSRPSSSTACISYWVTMGASSGRPPGSGLRWTGRCSVSGSARDHDGGGVDTVLAAEAFEALGYVDHPLHVGVGGVHLPQFGGDFVTVCVLGVLLEAGPQRRVPAHDQRGHDLGDTVADAVWVTEHPGRVPDRGPGLDGRERHHLRHMVPAPAFRGVADHLTPVTLVEVHVDIGHLLAPGV